MSPASIGWSGAGLNTIWPDRFLMATTMILCSARQGGGRLAAPRAAHLVGGGGAPHRGDAGGGENLRRRQDVVDDDEGHSRGGKLAADEPAHPAEAAHDQVVAQLRQVLFHEMS